MKKTYLITVLAFLLLLGGKAHGQDRTLSLEEFIGLVRAYHPISKQALLRIEAGEETISRARGAFDPYLYSNINQKYFDESTYYSLIGAGLKIPTWYGVEVQAGYDQNRGSYLNPENTLPSDGLFRAGISIPLGKGLFIDDRRATLKLAQVFADFTKAEQQKILNDLYFDALRQYWIWVQAWNRFLIHEEAIELAEERFAGIKQRYLFGDQPAIDTLEALIQVQQRQMQLNQSELDYQNYTLELSNYLWYENNTPLEITDSLRPPSLETLRARQPVSADSLSMLLAGLKEAHPEMQLVNYKLTSFDIERRMKAESLKPTVNLKYNALINAAGSSETSRVTGQDYVWGLELGFPLFLRKERADLKLTKIKIQDTELANQQKLLQLTNKVKNYRNDQLMLLSQVELYNDAVNNNNKMLQGEQKKFRSGESSLFLVNTRETKYIEAKLKLNEMRTAYFIANTGFIWAIGSLHLI